MIQQQQQQQWSSKASCKWSSGRTSLLQMIIRVDRPLANDHLDRPVSCKWSSGLTGLLQMIWFQIRDLHCLLGLVSYTNQMQQNTLYPGLNFSNLCVRIAINPCHYWATRETFVENERWQDWQNFVEDDNKPSLSSIFFLSDDEVKEWRNNSILDLAPDFSEIRTKSNGALLN